ncbi:hypothetical protein [Streptomyces sp. BRA346]|uniref:hypothetical protein n=1 Tax=Streptomyces sp. BRA346 TaxID=2878199 RepID=UPI004063C807
MEFERCGDPEGVTLAAADGPAGGERCARPDRAVLVEHQPGTFRLDMDKRLDLMPAAVPRQLEASK